MLWARTRPVWLIRSAADPVSAERPVSNVRTVTPDTFKRWATELPIIPGEVTLTIGGMGASSLMSG